MDAPSSPIPSNGKKMRGQLTPARKSAALLASKPTRNGRRVASRLDWDTDSSEGSVVEVAPRTGIHGCCQEKLVRFSPRSPLQRLERCRCTLHCSKMQSPSVVVDLVDSDTLGGPSSSDAPAPAPQPPSTRSTSSRKFVVLSSDEDSTAKKHTESEDADEISSPKKRKTSPEQIGQRKSSRLIKLSQNEDGKKVQSHARANVKTNATAMLPSSNKVLQNAEVEHITLQNETKEDNVQANTTAKNGLGDIYKQEAKNESTIRTKQESVKMETVVSGSKDHCWNESNSKSKDGDAARKVKETLRLFNSYYLRHVQEEEARCRKEESENSKKRSSNDASADRKKSRRPDLKAIKQMKLERKSLQGGKVIGHAPGIAVGDQFFSRCEMLVIGLHDHWLSGIAYLGATCKELKGKYRLPVALSLVLSGIYEDDVDNSDDVIYTGQGGNDLLGNKKQIADQIMERGNLALKHSMEQDLPVRLVRGHMTKKSYTGKVYTYDGLYKVKDFWAEKGISGFTVFKFRLRRVEGQPLLTTDQVHYVRGQVPTNTTELRGLVCLDLSGGLEKIPVPASNVIDDPPFAPTGFQYIANVIVNKNVPKPLAAVGCKCKGDCLDSSRCACAILNGKSFPYVKKNGGRLIEPVDVVYECGPQCGCDSSCSNRVSQRGLYYRLEVFRTATKGWGVRSWDHIPAGAPVCEYTGLLMRTVDADNISGSDYIFELDCLQTMKGIGQRQRRVLSQMKNHSVMNHDENEQPEYCIDAGSYGNIARFINHSCEPNLFVQCVLNTHHDLSQPRIFLVAAENIHPLQELTYDYGYELNSVVVDGQVKVLPCYCGVHGCRKRLY